MKPIVLIDTNVVIDLLAKREPFCYPAAAVFDLAERGRIDAYLNALTLVTVYYILHSYYKVTHEAVLEKFAVLQSYIQITDVTAQHIRQAQQSNFTDFEDAVIFFSAKDVSGLTDIITRNVDDFSEADVNVLTPTDWLALHTF